VQFGKSRLIQKFQRLVLPSNRGINWQFHKHKVTKFFLDFGHRKGMFNIGHRIGGLSGFLAKLIGSAEEVN
jgi:hypothetical protein